ncbi:MAG: ATP-grasp domain-containing protein [Bacilli bacterium]
MKKTNEKIIFEPIILGSYIGAYSIARSFHEEYNVKSTLFSSTESWVTKNSKIVNTIISSDLKGDKLLGALIEYGKTRPNVKKIIFTCAEWNTELILKNKEILEKYYIIPSIDYDLFQKLANKESFYEVCDKLSIDYPKTILVTKDNYKTIDIGFSYPIIMKASSTDKYINCNFHDKKKIYVIENKEEYLYYSNEIYNNGYNDTLIVQKFIEGEDSNIRAITCYCNKNSDVVFSCLAQGVIEEKAPLAIGNYPVMITRVDEDILNQAKKFLKHVKYTGFANFDLKYDNNNKFYFLEINPRLPRSSYVITGSGYNYTKYVIDEYIYNKTPMNEVVVDNEHLYTYVPFYCVNKYVKDRVLVKEVKELIRNKKYSVPYFYDKDKNIKTYIYGYLALFKQILKFRKYYK